MTLNVVHPYIYRLQGEDLVMGEIPEFTQRDIKIGNLVKTFLDSNRKVIWHQEFVSHIQSLVSEVAVVSDSQLGVLGDSRVIHVSTDIQGVPFSDSYLEIKENCYFIGGLFEACLANLMGVHYSLRGPSGKGIFYIPELCVSRDTGKYSAVEKKILALGIKPIPYEDALKRNSN